MIFKLFWTIWGRLRAKGTVVPQAVGGPIILLPVFDASPIDLYPVGRQPIQKPVDDATPIDLEVLR